MARTRFMPPPQIGFAAQTYRTFGAQNKEMGQIRQECWDSILDKDLQVPAQLNDPIRRPERDQKDARPLSGSSAVHCAAEVHGVM